MDNMTASPALPELGTQRFKPHMVLGDAKAYEEAMARASKDAEPPPLQGLEAFDASAVPKDIWDAANLVADRGVEVVRAYVHLTQERRFIQQQLEASLAARRHDSGVPGTSTASAAGGSSGRVAPGQLLSKATIEDYLRAGHDERVVHQWRKQLLQWAEVEANLMAATGKTQEQLTLNRSEEWRHKLEIVASLLAAKAVRAEATTPAEFNMTLRAAHERYVMIGNIFSGLFLSVKANASPQMALSTVKRPSGPPTASLVNTLMTTRHATSPTPGSPGQSQLLRSSSDAFPTAGALQSHAAAGHAAAGQRQGSPGHASSMRSGTAGRTSPLRAASVGSVRLQQQTLRQSQQQQQGQQLQGQQMVHRPFNHVKGFKQPDERGRRWEDSQYLEEAFKAVRSGIKEPPPHSPDVGGLEVVGQGLEDALWGVCQREVGLADVEAFLVHSDPQLLKDLQAARRTREATEAAAAADVAKQAAQAAARAAAQQLPKQGPHLLAATERLPFFCLPGCSHTAVMPVTNVGTAAVYYSWGASSVAAPSSSGRGSGGSSSTTTNGVAVAGAGQQPEQRFYQPDQKGVILPGETREFSFTFKSQLPGTFSELWTLNTTPQLAGRGRRGPITVLLRGVAASSDATSSARNALEAELAEAERTRKVTAVIDGIINALVAKPLVQPAQQAADASVSSTNSSSSSSSSSRPPGEAEKWLALNDKHRPPVYYSPATAARLQGLYARARAMLASETAAAQVAMAEAKKAKKKPDDPSIEQPPPEFPTEWDCCVDTLMSALAALDARQGLAARQLGALLRKEAGAALVEARQPDCKQRMVALACRRALVGLATAVPAAAASARALAYPNARGSSGGSGPHSKHSNTGPRASITSAGSASQATASQVAAPPAGDAAAAAPPPVTPRTAAAEAAALYSSTFASAVEEATAEALSQIEASVGEQKAELAAHLDGRAEIAAAQLRQLEEAGIDRTDELVEDVAWRRFALLRAKQQLGCA